METIIWFKNKCVKDIEKAIELKKQGKIVVMDTYWVSNDLHITTLTKDFEQEILLEKAKLIANYLPKPDVVIFLDASEEKRRNFEFERQTKFYFVKIFGTRFKIMNGNPFYFSRAFVNYVKNPFSVVVKIAV